MAAINNKSGTNRVAPVVRAGSGASTSIDDDHRQAPTLVVAFTVQDMIQGNNTNGNKTNPYQMIL
jgi:hypothetical protein